LEILGELELSERQMIYPSPKNPRLKGLTAKDPSIRALAESIRKDGLMQPVIVQKVGDRYEVVDGDRRCVAVFRCLRRETIRARAYLMSELEATRLRLVANIQRQDLSTQEKGSYCFELFRLVTRAEGLVAEDVWKSSAARSKYLAEISADIGVTVGTVINWIRLWNTYPPEAQMYIARNKEDLREGLIAPGTAVEAGRLATPLNVSTMQMLDAVKQYRMSPTEITVIRRQITDGEDVEFGKLPEILKRIRKEYSTRNVTFDVSTYRPFLDKCRTSKMRFNEYLSLALGFVLEHRGEFDKYVVSKIGGTQN
jgi:ParB/RepB/Spo0J family partition protein